MQQLETGTARSVAVGSGLQLSIYLQPCLADHQDKLHVQQDPKISPAASVPWQILLAPTTACRNLCNVCVGCRVKRRWLAKPRKQIWKQKPFFPQALMLWTRSGYEGSFGRATLWRPLLIVHRCSLVTKVDVQFCSWTALEHLQRAGMLILPSTLPRGCILHPSGMENIPGREEAHWDKKRLHILWCLDIWQFLTWLESYQTRLVQHTHTPLFKDKSVKTGSEKKQMTQEAAGKKKKSLKRRRMLQIQSYNQDNNNSINQRQCSEIRNLSKYSTHRTLLRDRWLAVQIGSRLHLPDQAFAKIKTDTVTDRAAHGEAGCPASFVST